METLRIIVARNSYRERGGEDAVVDAEIALLRENGHEVSEYRHDNRTLPAHTMLDLLQSTLWSRVRERAQRHARGCEAGCGSHSQQLSAPIACGLLGVQQCSRSSRADTAQLSTSLCAGDVLARWPRVRRLPGTLALARCAEK